MNKTTCQICAREIRANAGVIAHHGYQRPGNGWQTSSCLGARYEPYEISRGRIPAVRETYKDILKNNKKRLKDTMNSPPDEITESFGYISYRKAEVYKRPSNFDRDKALQKGYFTPDERYESEYRKLVKQIKTNIDGITKEIDFLTVRYDNWKKV